MRKTEQSIKKAVDNYLGIVQQEFPGLEFEVTLRPEAGVDAWLWMQIDPSNQQLRDEIEAFTSDLTERLAPDEDDMYIVAIPHVKEPVHG